MTRAEVKVLFEASVMSHLKDHPEVYRFIMKHDRKNLAIDNLTKQIHLAETISFIKRQHIGQMVDAAVTMFVENAKRYHDEQRISQAEKALREHKANEINDLESTFLKDQEKEALSTAHKVFIKT